VQAALSVGWLVSRSIRRCLLGACDLWRSAMFCSSVLEIDKENKRDISKKVEVGQNCVFEAEEICIKESNIIWNRYKIWCLPRCGFLIKKENKGKMEKKGRGWTKLCFGYTAVKYLPIYILATFFSFDFLMMWPKKP